MRENDKTLYGIFAQKLVYQYIYFSLLVDCMFWKMGL